MSSVKGIYILLVRIKNDSNVMVGALGARKFRKGLYAYVGSAQNSLEKRIERHFRSKKKKHWHIDYLLASESVGV